MKGFLRSTRSVKKQNTQQTLPIHQLPAHPLLIQNQKEFRDELNHECGRVEKGSWLPSSPVVLKTHSQVQLEGQVGHLYSSGHGHRATKENTGNRERMVGEGAGD